MIRDHFRILLWEEIYKDGNKQIRVVQYTHHTANRKRKESGDNEHH